MKIFLLITLASSMAFSALPARLLPVAGSASLETIQDTKNKKLVYFWATWCTTCGEKLTKALPNFRDSHKDIEVVTVSVDTEKERIEHYVKKQNVSIPVLFDPSGKITEELEIVAVPHWIVYRREAPGRPWEKVASDVSFDLEKIKKATAN